ncbi:uncharacterized protein J7T54_005335 [Emericellopsis cladophorae]|uniref:Mitochondrial transcription factor 1 n=1 Tax=Emericellopsis cladophorae TaxID=2686198 RepID=A0A9Q0BBU8_9HYPO|nr:uncharacterized protein J7T54_005335 [Emericellopsis cladophorae]KAI6778429.1 hypothetical protein J7T54_005335 [Emericellopsis cladophorae]
MIVLCRHAPPRLPPRLHACGKPCQRAYATAKASTADDKAATPIAKQLKRLGAWSKSGEKTRIGGRKRAKNALGTSEARRVNIVNEELCDEAIRRLGKTLEKHKGCDILDIGSGACLWSRALHDTVQPRRHLILDAAADLYEPVRKEVMGERQYDVIPKSGILWSDLNPILDKELDPTHKRPVDETTPHDDLLITLNISIWPKKSTWGFDNVTQLLLYQIMHSIRTHTQLQRYAKVRMLVWCNDETKKMVLPRTLRARKRSAFEAQMSCEWIREVAGSDEPSDSDRLYLRDKWIDYESAAGARRSMETLGLSTPRHRETRLQSFLRQNPSLLTEPLAGVRPPLYERPFRAELAEVEAAADSNDAALQKRVMSLRSRNKAEDRHAQEYLEHLHVHDRLMAMDPSDPDFAALAASYEESVTGMKKNQLKEYVVVRDNYHMFKYQDRGLLWDQRPYEPLAVSPLDFYPNKPLALLDIQPKLLSPVLRNHGPNTDRSGDYGNIILKELFHRTAQPIAGSLLDNIAPGFAEMVEGSRAPSLWDPKMGGNPLEGESGLTVRGMSVKHFEEMMEAWMRWPFRPDYLHMLARSTTINEEVDNTVDDDDMAMKSGEDEGVEIL